MIGQTIDNRYQVDSLIGRGGMGAVYQAIDLAENRPVALKVLHYFIDMETEVALTRFQREFRVLARLKHPNIVQAYDYGTYQDTPYLILEFLSGHTLTTEITAGPLPRERSILIARQISEALVHLHSQSIVHRDLKPGNLMLLKDEDTLKVKLMDFGLVRINNLSGQLTQEGVALGTVAYMAPEQAQGIQVDFRADLYALGTVLYEMAAGRPPFVHQNPAMILMQQLTTQPPSPRQFNPNLDEPLEQFILDLLAKEPAQRPNSTELVVTRLADLASATVPTFSTPPKQSADLIPRIPLIGREAALSELSQRWAEAQTGHGQIVAISGVAGVGKTRLVTEASLQAQLGHGRFIRGGCREYGSLPYEPLVEIVDLLLQDLPASVKDSLPVELIRLLSSDIEVPADTQSEQPLSGDPAEARSRLFAGFWTVFRQAAQKQPLMIVVEDVQWADPTTFELRSYLARRVGEAPILLIITCRPEEVEPSSPLAAVLQNLQRDHLIHIITLDLLTRVQIADFLKAALGQERIPEWLLESFCQATGGNPLFIEETLKALAAEGQLTKWTWQDLSQSLKLSSLGLQLPQNVLALAERRLQMLADDDRPILTAAAVLGPEFSFALLETVAKVDEDTLLDAIDRLLAAHLISELPLQGGEDRYRFTQEALRQALLRTISQRRVRRLHQHAGESIQQLHDTSQPRYWPILAHHFDEAGQKKQALKYFTLAADGAANIYANAEAVMYYNRALEIATAEIDKELAGSDQLRHLFTRRGRSLELSSQFEAALDNYKQMASLAHEYRDQALELAALTALTTIQATPTSVQNIKQAETLSKQALTLSRQLGDRQAEAKVLWNLVLVHRFLDQATEAVAYGEQSLAIARELNLREQMAYTLNDMSWAYLAIGQPEKLRAALDEARNLWRELGNMPMLADNLYSAAGHHALRGDIEHALDLIDETLRISRSINNLWNQAHSWSLRVYIYLERGEYAKAIEAVEKTATLSEQSALSHLQLSAIVDRGWVYGLLGDFERGLELGRQARAKAAKTLFGWRAYPTAMMIWLHLQNGDLAAAQAIAAENDISSIAEESESLDLVWIALAQSELALGQQDYPQAIAIVDRLVARLRQLDIKIFVSHALYTKSRALLAQNKVDEAYETLTMIRAEAEVMGLRRGLWPILYTLSQIEARRGNVSEADALRRQAQEIIEYMADHAPPDLRNSFLALPQIRKVLEDINV
jgi:predicted ATPase